MSIQQKQKRLIEEKRNLRKKCKEIRKRLGYLCARDFITQLQKLNIPFDFLTVNFEKLNWVENKGGKWDFSQLRNLIEQKLSEKGIKTQLVSCYKTSSKNPFLTSNKNKNPEGEKRKDRYVYFKNKKEKISYKMDRDNLASINIALNEKNKKNTTKYFIDFYQTKNQYKEMIMQFKK